MPKIQDLTELTTPADGDFLPIVDVSESNQVKKIQKSNLSPDITINTLDEKTTPVDADLFLIEDSADENAQKKLTLLNILKRGLTYSTSDDLIVSADTEQSTKSDTFVLKKSIKILIAGTYRIKFDLKTENAGATARGRIYKSGVGFGTAREKTGDTNYTTYSEDLAFNVDDTCELWLDTSQTAYFAYGKNFRIYGTPSVTNVSACAVITN